MTNKRRFVIYVIAIALFLLIVVIMLRGLYSFYDFNKCSLTPEAADCN